MVHCHLGFAGNMVSKNVICDLKPPKKPTTTVHNKLYQKKEEKRKKQRKNVHQLPQNKKHLTKHIKLIFRSFNKDCCCSVISQVAFIYYLVDNLRFKARHIDKMFCLFSLF